MSNKLLRYSLLILLHNMLNLPRIGITMGDAAGIGPEIIVKALSRRTTYQFCSPIVIGSASILQDALRFTSHPLKIRALDHPQSEKWSLPPSVYETIDVLDIHPLQPCDIPVGMAHPLTGKAAVNAIRKATQLALGGQIDAITTAPICKAAIHLAGCHYPGHTEMLAALTNTPRAVMMLIATGETSLRVSFVTNHLPLAEVSKHLSIEKILDVISVTHDALLRLGIISPKLVVAALNPHAGESGILGKEETEIIIPAVKTGQAHGYDVEGPLPADTLFIKAKEGRWDAVVAMYHDQGNIPIKLLAFGNIVNVTLGLPIIRTSVDHGTAFDIAGRGIASESSLVTALKFAASLWKRK